MIFPNKVLGVLGSLKDCTLFRKCSYCVCGKKAVILQPQNNNGNNNGNNNTSI